MEGAPRSLRFKGLTTAEVEASRRAHGANVLTPPPREPWWKLFLEKFGDPIIRILMIAAVLAIIAGIAEGKYLEGVGIIVAILLATVLAFFNEHKANQEFDILNKVTDDVPIKVIRNGAYTETPRRDLVVGDAVLIEAGEEIPADGRILEAVGLQVDEARLTGESVPVTKLEHDPARELKGETAYAPDRAYRSTIVKDGYGILEVTAVGDASEIGKTARAAAEETGEETPLNQQLERLSKVIGVFGFLIASLTFVALVVRGLLVGELVLERAQWVFAAVVAVSAIVGLSRVLLPILYDALELLGREGDPPAWLERDDLVAWLKTIGLAGLLFAVGVGGGIAAGVIPSAPGLWLPGHFAEEVLKYFMIAVTIIVVAVPEGLAMSVTLSLAYSMRRMTASNNLVRRMHACETIGAATVICSDKTGTLTLNEMQVHSSAFPALGTRTLAPTGGALVDRLVIEALSANTTAQLSRQPGEPTRALGNPTEGALLMWLEGHGIDYIQERMRFAIICQWTFSTERKYMGTLGQSEVLGARALHVKGAPEIVLGLCRNVLTGSGVEPLGAHRARIEAELKEYQARGMRTLGFAYHESAPDHEGLDLEQIAKDLTWLGFVAIADPVRKEVPAAIQACREAGVGVKVVTGDNPETAREIARQIGLWLPGDGADRQLTGPEFGKLDDVQAGEAAGRLKVLARARPMDKMRLVKLLQERGEVVAVTGDGTNDAPALNYANVGLAMGKTGTAVAKEASDIILLDDSFKSIVNAVMWGRCLYENIQRFILFQLTINVVALGVALLGPFIGVKLPLTVTQMLWVNLIMDTFAALALATEPPHWSVMSRPPRKASAFIVTGPMARSIFGVGAVFLVFLIGFLFWIKGPSSPWLVDGQVSEYGLSVFFSVFVLLQFWNLFNARMLGLRSSAFKGLFENKSFVLIAGAILVGQILIVQFGGKVFQTVPLSFEHWAVIIAGTSVVLWIGEIVRLVRRMAAPDPEPGSASAA